MIDYNSLMYILSLINNRGRCNCSALAAIVGVIHDLFTDLLNKNRDGEILLWYCIQRIHPLTKGYLIIDDTWIEKCFSYKSKSVTKQWSGKYKTTLFGITVVMLLWADGKYKIPLDIRIWIKGWKTKPELALEMLSKIRNKRSWTPYCVLFDSAYATKEILSRIHDYGWVYVTRCPKNRLFNGVKIWRYKRRGYWTSVGKAWFGKKIKAIRVADRFYICNRLTWSREKILDTYFKRNIIEEAFRILKQEMGFKGCQLQNDESHLQHLYSTLITFLVLEDTRIKEFNGITIYELRRNIISGKKLFYPSVLKRISSAA